MNDGVGLIRRALGVPADALHSEEAKQRSTSTALLRRTPGLKNILKVVNDPNLTSDLWEELEIMLLVNGRVIERVAKAIYNGDFDSAIGRYPDPKHVLPRDRFEALLAEIKLSIEVQESMTVEELLDDESLPVGPIREPWLALIVNTLVEAVSEHVKAMYGVHNKDESDG